jgi:hypothetical protein
MMTKRARCGWIAILHGKLRLALCFSARLPEIDDVRSSKEHAL